MVSSKLVEVPDAMYVFLRCSRALVWLAVVLARASISLIISKTSSDWASSSWSWNNLASSWISSLKIWMFYW